MLNRFTKIDQDRVYSAVEVQKSLEWGMKPLLDLMDLETAKEILQEQVDKKEGNEKDMLHQEVAQITAIHFRNFDVNTGEILLLFGTNPSQKLVLKRNLQEEFVLVGKKKRQMNQTCQDFFQEHLNGFIETALPYQTYFPSPGRSLYSACSYQFPVDEYCKIEFHPFYPSIVSYPDTFFPFPDWRLKEIRIPGYALPTYFVALMDIDYLNRENDDSFVMQYQNKNRYYLKRK